MSTAKMSLNVKNRIKDSNSVPDIDPKAVEDFTSGAVTERQKKPLSDKRSGKSIKVVRDTFSFPEDDYKLINALKVKYAKMGLLFNKSEVLRAGLHVLNVMEKDELKETGKYIKKIKVGRPTKSS